MKKAEKLNLANIPTPVEHIKYNSTAFYIKRDDLTGLELSGNKIRKLEYILHDVKEKNCTRIITCGGEQINHSRAAVIAGAKLGFKTDLFLWGDKSTSEEGNHFLSKFFGADITYVNKDEYNNINSFLEERKLSLSERGINAYIVPEGGSSPLGIFGYINFYNEIKDFIQSGKVNSITCAAGSGGTAAGLLLGTAVYNINFRIFAVNVLYPGKILIDKIKNVIEGYKEEFDLNLKVNYDNLVILDGYSEEGYKNILPEKLSVIKDFALQSGILFDPVYTGKAFYAFKKEFIEKGKAPETMFLHTGGLFGVFPKANEYLNTIGS